MTFSAATLVCCALAIAVEARPEGDLTQCNVLPMFSGCLILPCAKSRGPTFCIVKPVPLPGSHFYPQCQCMPGHCLVDNVCQPDKRIPKDCDTNSRVPCDCKTTITGTVCTPSPKSGPAFCAQTGSDFVGAYVTGVCNEGYCAEKSHDYKCERREDWKCFRDSGGTDNILPCRASRGPTENYAGMCMCQKGFCSNENGTCVEDEEGNVSQQNSSFAAFSTLPRQNYAKSVGLSLILPGTFALVAVAVLGFLYIRARRSRVSSVEEPFLSRNESLL